MQVSVQLTACLVRVEDERMIADSVSHLDLSALNKGMLLFACICILGRITG